MNKVLNALAPLLISAVIAGCSSSRPAPVADARPASPVSKPIPVATPSPGPSAAAEAPKPEEKAPSDTFESAPARPGKPQFPNAKPVHPSSHPRASSPSSPTAASATRRSSPAKSTCLRPWTPCAANTPSLPRVSGTRCVSRSCSSNRLTQIFFAPPDQTAKRTPSSVRVAPRLESNWFIPVVSRATERLSKPRGHLSRVSATHPFFSKCPPNA